MTTDIDAAHAAMNADPEDDAARLRFYERVADSELFLLLAQEPEGDQITPEVFTIQGQQFVLVFDREERLSEFTGRIVPYAGLPGRALAGMLAGQNIGIALNLEVAPSSMLIPSEGVVWLSQTLQNTPQEANQTLVEIRQPHGLPQDVLNSLDRKLALAAGRARCAYVAAAIYDGGGKGYVLAFVDAMPNAESALAQAANEALTFSGIEAGFMDVLFCNSEDELAMRLARVGLRFDLPDVVHPRAPAAPGTNPDKPPKLR